MAGDIDLAEALVLSDAAGNLYVIPRDILETYKATDEQTSEIEQLLSEDDVTGFAQVAPGTGGAAAQATSTEILTGSFFNVPPISRVEGGRGKQ